MTFLAEFMVAPKAIPEPEASLAFNSIILARSVSARTLSSTFRTASSNVIVMFLADSTSIAELAGSIVGIRGACNISPVLTV